MSNYAEELTYWFYRLNGYFLINNFVIHNTPENRLTSGSDVDLLAIRFPFVSEPVGGQADDWHSSVTEFTANNSISAVIVEVKSGSYQADNLFLMEDIRYVLPRFGCFSEILEEHLNNIHANPDFLMEAENVRVSKVLVAESVVQNDRFHSISLEEIRLFISERMAKYSTPKNQSRLFFPSDLLQHLINEEHRRIEGQNQQD
ncbi:MAG: hypothetical protein AAFY76_02295 [Cyanobacteria bacterium J06649_11]